SEYALRLLPLIGGLATLPVFVRFARRLYRDDADVLWAALLVTLSPKLIEHSNQVKHLTFDVLGTRVLLQLAWRIWETPPSPQLVWAWAIAASLTPWFAYSNVFVFFATSMILAVPALRRWSAAQRRTFLLANITVLLSLLLLAGSALQQRTVAVVAFWY